MRARLALLVSGIRCEMREITLAHKPSNMLEASPKGTVPVLVLKDRVLDQSLDIMQWALQQKRPRGLVHIWTDVRRNSTRACANLRRCIQNTS
jgi:glutathione S-transferase